METSKLRLRPLLNDSDLHMMTTIITVYKHHLIVSPFTKGINMFNNRKSIINFVLKDDKKR